MAVPETCAVCGKAGGRLDPYRDIARACGWAHDYAHLDCARYRVSTLPHYTVVEVSPGLYAYRYLPEPA